MDTDHERKRSQQALRAIRGALAVVARTAGLDLQEIGVERYAPACVDPYPFNELPTAAVEAK